MADPTLAAGLALAALAAVTIALMAGLKGWQGWLELKRFELTQARGERSGPMDRIEIADLRERVRKLESIAACVDL